MHISSAFFFFFFFNDTATTEIYTLSLHDALPISLVDDEGLRPTNGRPALRRRRPRRRQPRRRQPRRRQPRRRLLIDRKSTRLNSSHLVISYAVFCLKKKKCNTTTRWHLLQRFAGR